MAQSGGDPVSYVGGDANRACPAISSALGTPLPMPGKELLVPSHLGGPQGVVWRGQGLCHSFTHRVIPSCHLPGRTESQGWRTGAWVPGVRGGRWVSHREVVVGRGGDKLCVLTAGRLSGSTHVLKAHRLTRVCTHPFLLRSGHLRCTRVKGTRGSLHALSLRLPANQ